MGLFEAVDRSVATLGRGLEMRARRQAALAANVANADTPGYRAQDVAFGSILQDASRGVTLSMTHERHFSGLRSAAGGDRLVFSGGILRRDGNDVNIDSEMVKLAQNQIEYQFLARAASGKFRKLKEAITGRTSP